MLKKTRKLWLILFMLFCSSLLLGFTVWELADINIHWSSINSGGQRIAADDFVINASIGQPAVSRIEGQGLRLVSGFWVDTGPVVDERLIFLPLVIR